MFPWIVDADRRSQAAIDLYVWPFLLNSSSSFVEPHFPSFYLTLNAQKVCTKGKINATSRKLFKTILFLFIGDASASDTHIGAADLTLYKETYIRDLEKKKVGRQSAISFIHSTNMVPFRFNGTFMCLYCPSRYKDMPDLAQHVQIKHDNLSEEDVRKAIVSIRKYLPIKVHLPDFTCKVCSTEMSSFEDLIHHLIGKHKKPIELDNYGVWPQYITKTEFNCVLCGLKLEEYRLLNKHIIKHYSNDSKGKYKIMGNRYKEILVIQTDWSFIPGL